MFILVDIILHVPVMSRVEVSIGMILRQALAGVTVAGAVAVAGSVLAGDAIRSARLLGGRRQ